ncbi:MAG: fibronectin type III domain-containing protein, partial [bacterium]|nr:fibronectin type III domain-containing protein [bacterium]
MSWKTVPGATGYEATVQDFYTGKVVTESPRLTGTSHTFRGLAPQPLGYMVWVSALDEDRESSSLLKCAVNEAGGVSGASSNVRCKKNDDVAYKDKLKIEWDAVQGATGYTVERWLVPILETDTKEKLETVTTTATSYEFTGLVRSRVYNFKVKANAGDLSAEHGEVKCRTYVLPAPTRSGIACATTHNSIIYSWDPVADAERYGGKIQLDKRGSPQTEIPTPTPTAGGTRITSTITDNDGARLLTATRYFVGVLAFLNDIPQHWTGIACWTSPAGPSCSNITSTEIRLSWNPGRTAQDFYVYVGGQDNKKKATHVFRDAYHTFTGLTPNTSYTLNVEAGPPPTYTDPWIKRSSPASIQCKTKPPPRPDKPSDLACVDGSATDSSFSVSWTVSPGATKYQGRVKSGNWMRTDSFTSHQFSGLSPGGSYGVEVQAGNSGGWSDSASVTCPTLPDEPVVSCVAGSATTSKFTASWDAVTGAMKYRANRDRGAWLTPDSSTSHEFSGLAAGGEFEVEVQAGNDAGWSASGEKTCHTLPDPPTNLACSAATTSSFKLGWEAPTGASDYRVDVAGGGWSVLGNVTSHTFSGLAAGGSFAVEVQAGNTAGWGASGKKICQTLPLKPVVTCSAETTSAFTANWASVTGAEKYRARIAVDQNSGWTPLGKDTTSHEFSGLGAGRSFAVEVQAGNDAGWSASGKKTCHTQAPLPDPPARPSNLVCSGASTSGFTLGWDAPSGATAYQVRVGSGRWLTPDSSTSHGFSGLAAGGSFEVEVQAGNSGGWSPSSSATCYTLTVAPAVVCVAGSASVSGFTASWAAVGGA